jgi:pimeloyl-ACP methyl ester carboxylesterase
LALPSWETPPRTGHGASALSCSLRCRAYCCLEAFASCRNPADIPRNSHRIAWCASLLSDKRPAIKPALVRPADYENLIARLRESFSKERILKARAIENRLMDETWSMPAYDLLPKLKSLRIPTLVISGDHEFIPAATAEHTTQAIPDARLVRLKDCGHFSYLEFPVAVRVQIDVFFRANEPCASAARQFGVTSTVINRRVC